MFAAWQQLRNKKVWKFTGLAQMLLHPATKNTAFLCWVLLDPVSEVQEKAATQLLMAAISQLFVL